MLKRMMIITVVLFSLAARADGKEDVPENVREECLQAVVAKNPLKITYNWGRLKLDATKTTEEVIKSCGSDVAGCFHSNREWSNSLTSISIEIGQYDCFYPVGEIHFDFSNSWVAIEKDYSGCYARAVLRHELQHFMIWKTGYEQMLQELSATLLRKSLRFCKKSERCTPHSDALEIVKNTSEKWRKIIEENNQRLDEIDHNCEKEVNYKVCEPLLVHTGSF